jgi:taurine transport system permease protein
VIGLIRSAAYSLGAIRWQVQRNVILPSALTEILTAMRIGIGFGWITRVAAIAYALDMMIRYIERKAIPWNERI